MMKMKFKMNNREWEIAEISQEDIRKTFTKFDGEPQPGRYFGLTCFDSYKIYLDKDICLEQKKQTLKHELMHCYIGCYISLDTLKCGEEDLCDISANSHDMIHKICEEYFKGDKNGKK